MTDLAARYRAIVAEVLTLEAACAERQGDAFGDEFDSRPRPPASDAAIADAEQKLGRKLPEPYEVFLRTFDGWENFSWSTSIFGTEELRNEAYEDAGAVFGDVDDPVPQELLDGLMIGAGCDDATRILLLESGEVVEWLYEENQRHPSLEAYLTSRKEILVEMETAARASRAAIEREWDPEHRAASDRALEQELEQMLAARVEATSRDEPAPRKDPPPEAVAPHELVLKRGERAEAEVCLGLTLYLAAAPTRDEVVATFRAFRKRFPFAGTLKWARAWPSETTREAEHPDDEAFVDALTVDDSGHFGLRVQLTLDAAHASGHGRNIAFLNVRGIPPEMAEDRDGRREKQARASFAEVCVPAHADPAALEALCSDLVDLLPVRSGHGGYFAVVWEPRSKPDPDLQVFDWCRRFWGIEVCRVDGWLAAAHRRLRGANWLTVLGAPFANVLDRANAWAGAPAGVQRLPGKYGVLVRAGEAPSLCDTERGELPAELLFVARAIDPLVVGGYAESGSSSLGGVRFSTFTAELPPFAAHHATGLHLHRFANPAGFLGPTPREQAEALIAELSSQMNTNHCEDWLNAKRRGNDDGFRGVLRVLYNASCGDAMRTELGVRALEFAARYPDWAPAQVYNNLLWAYAHARRYEDALAFMDDALRTAKNNPYTYHNAAGIFARLGRLDEAMDCVVLAKEHGYEKLERMKDDEDLAPIADRPEFKALFA